MDDLEGYRQLYSILTSEMGQEGVALVEADREMLAAWVAHFAALEEAQELDEAA